MWRGEEEGEARLLPLVPSTSYLLLDGTGSVSSRVGSFCTLCVRSVEDTEMPDLCSSGPGNDGRVAFLWVKQLTVVYSTMAFLPIILSDIVLGTFAHMLS